MASKLVCWKCGGLLRNVPRPIRRLSKCPHCRVDLHVCRLCRHYDPTVRGECRHDRAERVVDKESANFCTHYRPKPNAHQPVSTSAEASARGALESLFGLDRQSSGQAEEDATPPESEQARARRKLENLFGLDEEPDSSERDSD